MQEALVSFSASFGATRQNKSNIALIYPFPSLIIILLWLLAYYYATTLFKTHNNHDNNSSCTEYNVYIEPFKMVLCMFAAHK